MGRKTRRRRMLRKGDHHRHELYEWAVQDAEFEVDFMLRVYRRARSRSPRRLREDFCGTGLVCAEWVRRLPDGEALGLDLDVPTLEWGRRHRIAPLGAAASRASLREDDVRSVTEPAADVVCAFNFSYFGFRDPRELVAYFARVRESLAPDGLFFVDCFGGWESQQVLEEHREIETPHGDFVYVWDQAAYNPLDNTIRCHIGFEFAGGERQPRAFTYHWRLYTLAEIREAMLAAGFAAVEVWWDRSPDEDDNDFRPSRRAENSPGWLAYVVGHVCA